MPGHVAVSPACPAGYQIGVSVSLHWEGSEGRTAVERQRAAVEERRTAVERQRPATCRWKRRDLGVVGRPVVRYQ